MNEQELEFLQHSNYIEGVSDSDSLDQAVYAWEYLKEQPELDITVIRKVHKILMLHQPLSPIERGYFRTVPVWISGKKVEPDGINEAMIAWAVGANASVGTHNYDPSIMIKEDHIAYEKIHPFVDGNGRTGRMFMNWQRLKAGLPILIIREEERFDYYEWFK